MKLVHVAIALCLSTLASACDEGSSGEPGPAAPGAGGGKTDDVEGTDHEQVACTYAELDFEACQEEDGSVEACKIAVGDEYDLEPCCEQPDYAFCLPTNFEIGCANAEVEYETCLSDDPSGSQCERMINDQFGDALGCCELSDYAFCDLTGTLFCQEVSAELDLCEEETLEGCLDYQQTEYPLFEQCGLSEADGSCAGIAEDLAACEEFAEESVDCQEYVREQYPWGDQCCLLDEFPAVCDAYG